MHKYGCVAILAAALLMTATRSAIAAHMAHFRHRAHVRPVIASVLKLRTATAYTVDDLVSDINLLSGHAENPSPTGNDWTTITFNASRSGSFVTVTETELRVFSDDPDGIPNGKETFVIDYSFDVRDLTNTAAVLPSGSYWKTQLSTNGSKLLVHYSPAASQARPRIGDTNVLSIEFAAQDEAQKFAAIASAVLGK